MFQSKDGVQKNLDMVVLDKVCNEVWFRNNGICACNGYISEDFLHTLSHNLNSNPLADTFFLLPSSQEFVWRLNL